MPVRALRLLKSTTMDTMENGSESSNARQGIKTYTDTSTVCGRYAMSESSNARQGIKTSQEF